MTKQDKTILVIEDDELFGMSLEDALKASGFNVLRVKDGLLGIDAVVKKMPDLILTDFFMPRKNGFDFLKELSEKKLPKHIPVYMLTSFTDQEKMDKAIKLGAEGFFSKSELDVKQLVDIVKKKLADGA